MYSFFRNSSCLSSQALNMIISDLRFWKGKIIKKKINYKFWGGSLMIAFRKDKNVKKKINNKYGNFNLVLDIEEVEGIRRESYQLSHSIIILTNGEITTGYSTDENLHGVLSMNFDYNF